jgi:hypothetical protein
MRVELEADVATANRPLAKFKQVAHVMPSRYEFEKTTTRKIKEETPFA